MLVVIKLRCVLLLCFTCRRHYYPWLILLLYEITLGVKFDWSQQSQNSSRRFLDCCTDSSTISILSRTPLNLWISTHSCIYCLSVSSFTLPILSTALLSTKKHTKFVVIRNKVAHSFQSVACCGLGYLRGFWTLRASS